MATDYPHQDSNNPAAIPLRTITHQECLEHFRGFIRNGKPGLGVFYDDAALTERATIGTSMIEELLADGCGKQIAKDLALLTLYDMAILIGLSLGHNPFR